MITFKNRPKAPDLVVVVTKEGLRPRDDTAWKAFTEGGKFKIGECIGVSTKKVRSPEYHRMAHKIGTLCVNNLDDFEGLDAHMALKKLQLESNAGCDSILLRLETGETVEQRIPKSLSFAEMDEHEFGSIMHAICNHLSTVYFRGIDPREIYVMAKDADNI